MQGYKISFNIYANSEEEAKQAEKSLIDFINAQAQEGRAVSANKIVTALDKCARNALIKMQVDNFFK